MSLSRPTPNALKVLEADLFSLWATRKTGANYASYNAGELGLPSFQTELRQKHANYIKQLKEARQIGSISTHPTDWEITTVMTATDKLSSYGFHRLTRQLGESISPPKFREFLLQNTSTTGQFGEVIDQLECGIEMSQSGTMIKRLRSFQSCQKRTMHGGSTSKMWEKFRTLDTTYVLQLQFFTQCTTLLNSVHPCE